MFRKGILFKREGDHKGALMTGGQSKFEKKKNVLQNSMEYLVSIFGLLGRSRKLKKSKSLPNIINESRSIVTIMRGNFANGNAIKRPLSDSDVYNNDLKSKIFIKDGDYDDFRKGIEDLNLDSASKLTNDLISDISSKNFGSTTNGPSNRDLILKFRDLQMHVKNKDEIKIDNEAFTLPIIHSVNTSMKIIENAFENVKNIKLNDDRFIIPANQEIVSDFNNLKNPIFSDLKKISYVLGSVEYPISITYSGENVELGSSKKFYRNQIKYFDQFRDGIKIENDSVVIKKSVIQDIIRHRKNDIDLNIALFRKKIDNKEDVTEISNRIKKFIVDYKQIVENFSPKASSSVQEKANYRNQLETFKDLRKVESVLDKAYSGARFTNSDKSVLNEYLRNVQEAGKRNFGI